MSEIWTPDIELWNLKEGLSQSLEDACGVVGTIFDGFNYLGVKAVALDLDWD